MMEYKGYIGKVDFDDKVGILHGQVVNIRDAVTFQGQRVAELKKAFRESMDDYLAFYSRRGEDPERPFSGQFVTRIPPELHRQVNLAAARSGKSLNAWVAEQLQAGVQRVGVGKATGKRATAKARRSLQERRHDSRCRPKTIIRGCKGRIPHGILVSWFDVLDWPG